MSMPFLDLVNNIGGFKIKAKGYDLDMYRKHLKNMFLNMNTYFVKNNLYEANEYEMLLNLLVNSYAYTFEVHKSMPDKTRGRFAKALGIATGSVILNHNYFYNEEETEGYLCHEVIHLITTGLDYITYKTENGKVEIVVPDNNRLKAGYKKTYVDGKCVETKVLRYSDLGENNFLKEGLTEKLKQQIYPHYLCPMTYPVETNFVDILNFISNLELRDCFIEFLRGELVTYKKVLTKDVFEEMQKELKLHFDNENTKHNIMDSVHYKKALSMVLSAGCRHFDKTKPTLKQFFEYVNNLTDKVLVCDKEMLLSSTLEYATKVFNNTVSRNKTKTEEFKKLYEKYVELKATEIWYKNPANARKGFKLFGLSEEIYFMPCINGNSPASASMHEMDLTPCLIPGTIGHTLVFGSGSNSEKIFITRNSKNSVLYTQNDIQRLVVFEENKVKVLNEKDEVVELGYLSSFKNEKLKHDFVEEQTDKILSFANRCLKEKGVHSVDLADSKPESKSQVDEIYDDFGSNSGE